MTKIFGYDWETIQAMQQGGASSQALPPSRGLITPSQYEKREWSRMAQDAYSRGLNEIGTRFSTAAALRKGEQVKIAWFDAMQTEYRTWLVDGFNTPKL